MTILPRGWWLVPALVLGGIAWGALAVAAFGETRQAWGGYGEGWAEITPADGEGGHVATVTLRNRLTGGHLSEMAFDLTLGDVIVGVSVDHRPGDIPDTMGVFVGPDFIAVPSHIDVPEGADGSIQIFRRSDMVTG